MTRARAPESIRAMKLAPLLILLVLPLAGCVSIKSEGLSQRAPGVVTLGGVICGSDYNHSSYYGCDQNNVAEPDNRKIQGCDADGGAADPYGCGVTGDGQLMVGFRVPLGSEGPDSFATDARDLHFERNASYTQALQKRFPAPADEHWVGYLSDVLTLVPGAAAENPTGIHADFSLPQRDGPFRWRWVVGFRAVKRANAAGPVNCDDYSGICFDSPPEDRVATDLPAENVSDFSVTAQAGSFLVRYTDPRNLGPQDFTISASTGTPSVSTLHMQPNTTSSVSVSASPGPVTLTVTSGSVSRTATATVPSPPPPAPVAALPQITALPTGRWTRTKAGLRIRSMRLTGLPEGAHVDVVCKPCHVRHASTLTKLKNKILKRGQSFTVTVTKPGYLGERVTMTAGGGGFSSRRISVPA